MREMVKAGTVLFREGTLLPDSLTFESEPYSPGWRSVTGLDGCGLDRKIHGAGWTFFFLAGESRTTAFGRKRKETVRRAIKKILDGLKSEKSNSIEITDVVFKAFLGLPYARVSFHLRNFQKGMFLSGSVNSRPWRDGRFVAA